MHDDEMRDEPGATLQPSELEALQALRRDEDPGRLLEERKVRALQREGLLTAPKRRSLAQPLAWAAAAAIAFFAVGFALGRGSAAAPSHSDAVVRPAQRPAVDWRRDVQERDNDRVLTAATDTTNARDAARFVVWF